jgi:hypothetical protein
MWLTGAVPACVWVLEKTDICRRGGGISQVANFPSRDRMSLSGTELTIRNVRCDVSCRGTTRRSANATRRGHLRSDTHNGV